MLRKDTLNGERNGTNNLHSDVNRATYETDRPHSQAAEQIDNLDVQIEALKAKAASNQTFSRVFLILALSLIALNVAAPFFLGDLAVYLQVALGILGAVAAIIWLMGWAVTGINQAELHALYQRKDNLLKLLGLTSTSKEPSYFDQLVRINAITWANTTAW